jgi:uncharacterized protein
MQPLSDQTQLTITQVFTAFSSLMVKDIQAWIDLYAEDAVVEFPYAFDTPRRLEGKKAIYNYFKDALTQMQNLRKLEVY